MSKVIVVTGAGAGLGRALARRLAADGESVLYQASKAALERLAEGLHHELAASGIKVTTLRAGSMFEEGKTWEVEPSARSRFVQAAIEAGIRLRDRTMSHYASIASVFRTLIDLPDDVQVGTVTHHARAAAPARSPA